MLKDAGYATAAIGKWHLGDQKPFLPTNHGFDYYHGVPYSDDMTRPVGQRLNRDWPELPLLRNDRVVEAPVDRDLLTQKETTEAIRFIENNQDRPFFLYIPHAMPGSTLHPFASPAFKGKSENGAFGDSIEELDWSAGMILEKLEELGLDENTLIIWTSDNGAPRRDPSIPQGSNEPLAGSGYTTAEGGMRVPMIARWPDNVPAGGVNDALTTTMDLYVTFGKLAGAELPSNRTIDGRDISDLLLGTPGAESPHETFYYYHGPQLQAVRSGPYKLFLSLEENVRTGEPQEEQLYNVVTDPGETKNVIDQHPQRVEEIRKYAEQARGELGDLGREGSGQRQVGRVNDPTPRVPCPWQGPCPN
jgi:arylsulfatase A-like enzyme